MFEYITCILLRTPLYIGFVDICFLQMATQFMSQYSGHGASGPPLGHQSAHPSKSSNGRSFAFRKRYERIDWRRIASVDVDQVARTLDFSALQENIMNLTFCNIEAELVFKNFLFF